MRILGIAGSLRRDSYNRRLLDASAELLPEGAELRVWDRLAEVPPYDEDGDAREPHPVVADLKAAIADADVLLLSTPEYNHSIPGVLKNALDHVSRPRAEAPTERLPAGVIGASAGMFGAVWAQAEVRKVLGAMGARVLDEELPVGTAAELFEDGRLADEETREALRTHLAALLEHARLPVAA